MNPDMDLLQVTKKLPLEARLSYAVDYQTRQIVDMLRMKGINPDEEDIRDRIVLAMHSHAITDKIVKQVEMYPVKYDEMTAQQKMEVAGFNKIESGGTRETSRRIIEELTNFKEEDVVKGKSLIEKVADAQSRVKSSRTERGNSDGTERS
mgnify:CR=1 FL=1